MITQRLSIVFAVILLALFAVFSVGSALRESLTFDEIVHLEEGRNAWEKHQFVVDTNNPPLIRELAVLPLVLGSDSLIRSPLPNIRALPARLVIVLLGLVLGIGIFLAGKKYLGTEAGLFALLLYTFEPTILANSHYVTQDTGATLFFFLAYMSLVGMIRRPSVRSYLIHGILVGLMAASKITTIPYYALSALITLPVMLGRNIPGWFIKTGYLSLIAIPVCLVVIWGTYFFRTNVIIVPSETTGRVSQKLEQSARRSNNRLVLGALRFLRNTPVPMGDYIAVIKNTLVRSAQPTTYFFRGTIYTKDRWYFLPSNLLSKIPIPLLILFATGLFLIIIRKKSPENIRILTIPVLSILFVASVSRMEPLVRYVLPMYPFVILIAAYSFTLFRTNAAKVFLLILSLWFIVGTAGSYPHFISYTNELAGNGISRNLNFTDSNMDWGQSLVTFQSYIRKAQPNRLSFSYFGRDNADPYGFPSNLPYGSYKSNEICAFHEITYPQYAGNTFTAISISNWYACGYDKNPEYVTSRIKQVIGGSILLFGYDSTAL